MEYIDLLSDPAAWVALLTLIIMEVVLGIDNLIFISILTNKLPEKDRAKARRMGIFAALFLRLMFLGLIAYIVKLTAPVITLFDLSLSWKDIILITGGLFLIWKATREIHHAVDPEPVPEIMNPDIPNTSFIAVVSQILVIDAVFSIDSIITAVGMTIHVPIMIIAVIFSVITMLIAAEPLSRFINKNPTIVMLALGFLLLIGTTLIADGLGYHLPKGYIYTAMAFSITVEGLNMLSRRTRKKKSANVDDNKQ